MILSQSNSFSRRCCLRLTPTTVLVLTCLAFLLYGINSVLDYVVLGVFLASCIYLISKDELGCLCFPLYFFDYVLVLNVGGTFNRIYELIFLIVFFILKRRKMSINSVDFFAASLYFIFSSLASSTPLDIVSNFLNIIVIYIVFSEAKKEGNAGLHKILKYIAVAAFFSAIYALTRMNFEQGYRLRGTISDPNFAAFIYLFGIVSALCCKDISKSVKVFVLITLMITLFLTVSQTGILILAIVLFIYFSFKKPKIVIPLAAIIAVIFILFITIDLSSFEPIAIIQRRINRTLSALSTGDLDTVTSHRFSISKRYIDVFFNNISPFHQLFGGVDPAKRGLIDTSGLSYDYLVSHNSYIDMLFASGIVGTFFIVSWSIYKIIKYVQLFRNTRDTSYLGYMLIKVIMICFAFTLSFYGTKFFVLGYII